MERKVLRKSSTFKLNKISYYCVPTNTSGEADNVVCNMLDKSRTVSQFGTLHVRNYSLNPKKQVIILNLSISSLAPNIANKLGQSRSFNFLVNRS
jgi:hypothetical protein